MFFCVYCYYLHETSKTHCVSYGIVSKDVKLYLNFFIHIFPYLSFTKILKSLFQFTKFWEKLCPLCNFFLISVAYKLLYILPKNWRIRKYFLMYLKSYESRVLINQNGSPQNLNVFEIGKYYVSSYHKWFCFSATLSLRNLKPFYENVFFKMWKLNSDFLNEKPNLFCEFLPA